MCQVNCPQRGSKQRATPRCAPAHRRRRISSLRILVVDDSDVTRRVLGTVLRSRHWTVCGEAEDGWSGVKKFHELKPDLVLLDLAMPDMDGIEAARLMSGSDANCDHAILTRIALRIQVSVCRYRTSAKCDWRTIRSRARPEYCRSLPGNAQSVLQKCFDSNQNQYAKGVLPSRCHGRALELWTRDGSDVQCG